MAALYAASVVGVGLFFQYGGGAYGIGQIAAIVGFLVALFLALLLSPLFHWAKAELSGWWYFALHLVIGLVVGAIVAAQNPYVAEVHEYIYNNNAVLVSCASMAAWLYVVLSTPGDDDGVGAVQAKLLAYRPILLIAGVAVLAIPISYAPKQTDPSCHNVLRDGRMSAKASISVTMTVNKSDVDKLAAIYEQFAADHGLSIRGHPLLPDSAQRNMCDDDVTIEAGGVSDDGRHSIVFYQSETGSGWEPMAADLICRLESNWSESLKFTGQGGETIQRAMLVSTSCDR